MLLYSRCSRLFQWFRTITLYKKNKTKKTPTNCKFNKRFHTFSIFSLWSTFFTLYSISWGILKWQIFAGTNCCVLNHGNKTWNLKIHLPLYLHRGRRDRRGDSTHGRRLVWGLVVTLTPWRSSLCWWWGQLWPPSAPATPGPELCCWSSGQQTCRGEQSERRLHGLW